MHLDETNPHLHITFVPVYHAKRGLKKRVSFTKAIQEQLPDAPKKFMKFWSDKERDEIEKIANQFDSNFERKLVGSHKYLEISEYKNAVNQATEMQVDNIQAFNEFSDQYADWQVLNHELEAQNDELSKKNQQLKQTINLSVDDTKKELVNIIREINPKHSASRKRADGVIETSDPVGSEKGFNQYLQWFNVKGLVQLTKTCIEELQKDIKYLKSLRQKEIDLDQYAINTKQKELNQYTEQENYFDRNRGRHL